MTIDKSLRRKNTLQRARNVLNRGERIARLQAEERWLEGRSPFNLPKVKVIKLVVKKEHRLYEIVLALIIFAILWQLRKRKLHPGQLFAAFMGLYAIERFFIEFVRAKSDRIIFGLTTSQGFSIVLVIAAVILWVRQSAKPVWDPKNAPTPPPKARKTKQARSTA